MSVQQQSIALEKANRVRFYRSKLKLDVRAGLVFAADVLENPAPEILSMRAVVLLESVPHVGRQTAVRYLKVAGVATSERTIGELSARQRLLVAGLLRRRT